jgi:hypothetical protein
MPSTETVAVPCPQCQAATVACRFNFFDRGDLQIHSWEHRCQNCGWRETRALRSDAPPEPQAGTDPNVCPLCGRLGTAT